MPFMKYTLCYTATLLLVGCGGGTVQDTLGLNKAAPDEFRVVSRPPLSVPDEFYLYPPDEAATRSPVTNTQDKARLLLTGQSGANDVQRLERYQTRDMAVSGDDTAVAVEAPQVTGSALPSGGESRFLQQLGTNKRDEAIRTSLEQELKAKEAQDDGLLERLRSPQRNQETIVNASKEQQRIRDNTKEGKPVNEGEISTVTESESLWDWLF